MKLLLLAYGVQQHNRYNFFVIANYSQLITNKPLLMAIPLLSLHQNKPGGMREAIESAAPGFARVPGVFEIRNKSF